MYRARRPQVKFPAFATLSISRPPIPMCAFFRRLLRDEEGPTAVEYAVLLALILVAIMAGIGTLGSQTGGMWGNTDTQLSNAGLGSSS